MFYSRQHSLLFIACPKTGSTSVEEFLAAIDANGERFTITLDHRQFTSADVHSPSLAHATAREFRILLGAELYSSLATFGFVRHPIEKLVSTYFFNRQGRLVDRLAIRKPTLHGTLNVIARQVSGHLLARILPFSFWVRIWPMKRCCDYFMDESGTIIVRHLGLTERLHTDLLEILRKIGVDYNERKVPHVNQSEHRDPWSYIASARLRSALETKYSRDLALYELVRDQPIEVEAAT